jgi:hypothetical protein
MGLKLLDTFDELKDEKCMQNLTYMKSLLDQEVGLRHKPFWWGRL